MQAIPSWTAYFMGIAQAVATRSKDTSTQVGCVIVGPDREIRATGYNGMPRGIDDDGTRNERPEKYYWYEHAERNALYQAARIGASTKDCWLYCTAMPCMDCARGIVQAGITRAFFPMPTAGLEERWGEQFKRTRRLFNEARVEFYYYG